MTLSWKKKVPSSAKVQARPPAALFSENLEGAPAPRASSAPRLRAGLGGRSSVGTSRQPSTFRAHFHLCGLCPASSTHSVHFQRHPYSLPPPGSEASLGGRADLDCLSRSQMPRLLLLLSLCCCTRALSSCGSPGLLSRWGLLLAVAFLVAEQKL